MNRALRSGVKTALSLAADSLCPELPLLRVAAFVVLTLAVLVQCGRTHKGKGAES